MAYAIPGLSLKGTINPFATELVTRFVAKYINALKGEQTTWADVVAGTTGLSDGELVVKFPIDVDDLGPGFREWVGEREIRRTDLTGFVVESAPWERTKGISLRESRAVIFRRINTTAAVIAAGVGMKGLLVANILKQGQTKALTYQKIPLFVGSGAATKHYYHPLKAANGAFYNMRTGLPFTGPNFKTARSAHESVKAPDGVHTIGLKVTHVLGGTDMREKFEAVFERQLVANAAGTATHSNELYKKAIPLIAPELDDDPFLLAGANREVWYTIATMTQQGQEVMAKAAEYIATNNGQPRIQILGEGSEHAFLTNELVIGGDMDANAGAAFPQVIFRNEHDPGS